MKVNVRLLSALAIAAGLSLGLTKCAAGQGLAETGLAETALADATPASLSGPGSMILLNQSDFKFNLVSLMSILRDRRHEGWVLAAYPDPKTKRPLIGAGFSLDVEAREHPQLDVLNPHPFLEPSSAQLWQAAGLEPAQLERILERFDREQKIAATKGRRRKVRASALTPEVSEEEAMRLLRVSALQAIYNARAYCRDFDQLTAHQQMALSQLVFQMGVNLEQFQDFLGTLNGRAASLDADGTAPPPLDGEHWKTIQATLIDSQWARLYSDRAASVIAMFDPGYAEDPGYAQQSIETVLRPVSVHRRSGGAARQAAGWASVRTVALSRRAPKGRGKTSTAARRRRKLS